MMFVELGPIDRAVRGHRAKIRGHAAAGTFAAGAADRAVEVVAAAVAAVGLVSVGAVVWLLLAMDAAPVTRGICIAFAATLLVAMTLVARQALLSIYYSFLLSRLNDPDFTLANDPRLKGRRRADDPVFFDSKKYAMTASGKRQNGAVTLAILAAMAPSWALLEVSSFKWLVLVLFVAVCASTIAGALYHPSLEVWRVGALAGGCLPGVAMIAGYYWFYNRQTYVNYEIAIPLLPSFAIIYLLYRLTLKRYWVGVEFAAVSAVLTSVGASVQIDARETP